jgi:ribosome-associated protein
MIAITTQLAIPAHEVHIIASRSSGPGGQNVNKVNSRVTLHFHVWSSKYLTDTQKSKITTRLKSRMTKDGTFYLHAQGTRSQAANRADLIEKFATLLGQALKPIKSRKKTHIPHGTKERRLNQKKQRSGLKKERGTPRRLDD